MGNGGITEYTPDNDIGIRTTSPKNNEKSLENKTLLLRRILTDDGIRMPYGEKKNRLLKTSYLLAKEKYNRQKYYESSRLIL